MKNTLALFLATYVHRQLHSINAAALVELSSRAVLLLIPFARMPADLLQLSCGSLFRGAQQHQGSWKAHHKRRPVITVLCLGCMQMICMTHCTQPWQLFLHAHTDTTQV